MQAALPPISLGETAENVADRWAVSREDQDAFGLASQQRAVAAQAAGQFDDQIVPVTIPQRKGDPIVVDRDEHPRADTTAEALAKLRPAFREGGTVTAGNSSGINDGAAAVLLVEAGTRARPRPPADGAHRRDGRRRRRPVGHGHRPGARDAQGARPRRDRRRGPRPRRDERGLREPVASRARASSAWIRRSVNVDGGAIALGHPLGMSGARLVTMLVHELRTDRRPLRPRDDVHRRRPGDRDGRRAHRGVAARRHGLRRRPPSAAGRSVRRAVPGAVLDPAVLSPRVPFATLRRDRPGGRGRRWPGPGGIRRTARVVGRDLSVDVPHMPA